MLVLKRDGSSQVAQAVPGVGWEEAGGLGPLTLSSDRPAPAWGKPAPSQPNAAAQVRFTAMCNTGASCH